MPIAYSYVRFSTAEQAKGDSLRRQDDKAKAYADTHGLTLDESLTIRDLGVSAFKGANAEEGNLATFLKAIDEKRIPVGSYLLVESLDRLSREKVLDALQLFIRIINSGVILVSLKDNIEFSKESVDKNFTQLIVCIAYMSRAHEESDAKSMRIADAWNNKRELAKTTGKVMTKNTPFWLRAKDDWTGFEVIEDKAALVKRIFELSASGFGVQKIALLLNKEGLRTGSDALWHAGNIAKLLRSRRVIGEAVFSTFKIVEGKRIPTDPIPNYFPHVISEKLFYEVRDRLEGLNLTKGGGKKSEYRNLFRRLMKCPYCGNSISIQACKHNSKKNGMVYQTSLFCTGRRRGLDCPSKNWDYYEFQHLFLQFVKELDVTTLVGATAKTKEIEKLQAEFAKKRSEKDQLSKRLNNLLDQIEQGVKLNSVTQRIEEIEGMISLAELSMFDLDQAIHRLQVEVSSAQASKDKMGELISMLNDPLHSPAPYGEASEEDILLRSRLTVIIANLVEKIEMFSVGMAITEGVELSKDFRFMVIYFKSAVTRGLAWNGTSITNRIVDGVPVWGLDIWMGSEWPTATAENWIVLKQKWNSG